MTHVTINRSAFEIALAKKNLTQNGLARKIKVTSGFMSMMMTGKRQASATTRRRILQCLRGYTFDDLFIIEQSKDGDGHQAE